MMVLMIMMPSQVTNEVGFLVEKTSLCSPHQTGCYDGPEMELHCFGVSCRPVLKLLYKAVHTAVE